MHGMLWYNYECGGGSGAMTTSAKVCVGRPRGNCCLLYVCYIRWIALDAVIQENAQICVACDARLWVP